MEYNKETKVIYGGPSKFIIPDVSFGEMLFHKILQGGEKIALVDGRTEETLSYNELLRKAIIMAKTYQSFGLRKGDFLSLFSENRIEFTISILGALFVGIVPVPINFQYMKDELFHCLSLTKPRVIVCTADTLKKLLTVYNKCRFIEKVIVLDEKFEKPPTKSIVIYTFKYIMDQYKNKHIDINKFQCAKVNSKEDTAVIFSSSGTTGLPKGVMLTHHNLKTCYNITISSNMYVLLSNNNQLIFLPLFHAYGCLLSLFGLGLTATIVILNRFEEELYLKLLDKYHVAISFVVPPICVMLSKSTIVDQYNFTHLRTVFCGAAPLKSETEAEVLKKMKVPNIRQGYGLTESTLAVTITPDATVNKPGTAGLVVEGMSLKVVDIETGRSLGFHETGEICVKGDLLMKGYYNNIEATRNCIDSEGWLHTGDVGYYDEDLYFFIVDRIKELIKYKGFQVAPAELEGLLLANEHVKDVGVIGIPDDISGELPLAYIVRQPWSNITAEEIINYVKDRVSPQKRLHGGVIFINEIPKTPSGKILRRKLRELAKQKSSL